MSGICSAHQGHDPACPRCTAMPELPAESIEAVAVHLALLRGQHDQPADVDRRVAVNILQAAAPALRAQGAAAERAEADLRIADAVATEFCRIRALAKKVGAVYPDPGADRGPLREALRRQPYLPFADLMDADLPEENMILGETAEPAGEPINLCMCWEPCACNYDQALGKALEGAATTPAKRIVADPFAAAFDGLGDC